MSASLSHARELLAAAAEPTRLRGVHVLRDDVADRGAAAALLVDVLEDPGSYVPHAARAALQDLGEAAVPALLEGLRSRESLVRSGCAWALAREQGPRAREVLEALGALVSDEIAMVREAAAGALGRIDAAPGAREALLVQLAEDVEPRVRTQAVESLGGLPGLDGAGREALATALEDGRPAVRQAAAEALTATEPSDDLLARVVRALEEEPSEHVAAPLRALLERWRRAS
jgi:HEAT repeat protein